MQRPPRYDLPKAAPGPLRLVQLFLNTTDHEHGRELIGTPDALCAWLSEVGLKTAGVGPAAVVRAQRVRRELHVFLTDGAAGPAIAEAAARAKLTLDLAGGQLVPQTRGVDAALGTIVAIVYEAVRDGSWERLKACRNCGWAFWDESRNRSAAWCSMQLCGNRLKVQRHRARRGATPPSARSRRGRGSR